MKDNIIERVYAIPFHMKNWILEFWKVKLKKKKKEFNV